jgi:glycerol-3-phosphate acyltransferase PlsY
MTHFLFTVGFLTCSFIWGGIPTGYIVVKLLKGIDIRNHGSGNIGAANVRRVLGTPWFFGVLMLDAFKGALPMLLALLIFDFAALEKVIMAACVIGGSLFSPWLRFKGGKGIGTSLGVLFVLAPLPVLVSVVVFVSILFMFNYVSIASISSAIVFPIAIFVAESIRGIQHDTILLVFAILLACALVAMHRVNILKVANGTEHRFFVRKK